MHEQFKPRDHRRKVEIYLLARNKFLEELERNTLTPERAEKYLKVFPGLKRYVM